MPRSGKTTYEEANRGKQPTRAKKTVNDDILFAGWVNYTVPAEKQGEFEHWAGGDSVWPALDDFIASKHRITVSYDADSDAYIASAMCRDTANPNVGLMTSQRSTSAARAIFKLVYAVTELMAVVWSEHMELGKRDW